MITLLRIAETCHEVNKAYCESLGDMSQPHWKDAPEWQRSSAINGVKHVLNNPSVTPRQSHESWMAQKTAEGWKYGPLKDVEKKEHPAFLPYDELPTDQKTKDYLFGAIVRTLASFVEKVDEAAELVEIKHPAR